MFLRKYLDKKETRKIIRKYFLEFKYKISRHDYKIIFFIMMLTYIIAGYKTFTFFYLKKDIPYVRIYFKNNKNYKNLGKGNIKIFSSPYGYSLIFENANNKSKEKISLGNIKRIELIFDKTLLKEGK